MLILWAILSGKKWIFTIFSSLILLGNKTKRTLLLERSYFVMKHKNSLLVYTLKRNKITSPSFTTYSLPSERTSPCSLAVV